MRKIEVKILVDNPELFATLVVDLLGNEGMTIVGHRWIDGENEQAETAPVAPKRGRGGSRRGYVRNSTPHTVLRWTGKIYSNAVPGSSKAIINSLVISDTPPFRRQALSSKLAPLMKRAGLSERSISPTISDAVADGILAIVDFEEGGAA